MKYRIELEIDVDSDHPLIDSLGSGKDVVCDLITVVQDWLDDDDYVKLEDYYWENV